MSIDWPIRIITDNSLIYPRTKHIPWRKIVFFYLKFTCWDARYEYEENDEMKINWFHIVKIRMSAVLFVDVWENGGGERERKEGLWTLSYIELMSIFIRLNKDQFTFLFILLSHLCVQKLYLTQLRSIEQIDNSNERHIPSKTSVQNTNRFPFVLVYVNTFKWRFSYPIKH